MPTNIIKLLQRTRQALEINKGGIGRCPCMINALAEAVRRFRINEGQEPLMYKSKRGKLLICQEKHECPVITMENYCKWYNVYVIYSSGEIGTVDYNVLDEIEKQSGKVLTDNHLWHPWLLEEYAESIDGTVDPVTLDVVTGRWILEHCDKETSEI